MKTSILIFTALAVLYGVYLLSQGSLTGDQKYNWNLELTKPLDYAVAVQNVRYTKGETEIYRYTSMNIFSGWSGTGGGSVLHGKATAYLPDSVEVAWQETNSGQEYAAVFAFPKEQVLAYWKANNALLKEKWGKDYTTGPIDLKLGLAPEGNLTLWLAGLDTRTAGYALEVGTYTATNSTQQAPVEVSRQNRRYGGPHFYTFEGENVVAISVTYHNGETNSISKKQESDSILEHANQKRGWGLAKTIVVHWFDSNRQGYKSIYTVALYELADTDSIRLNTETKITYLLDRANTPDAEWHALTNNYVIELSESERKVMK